MTSDIFMRLPWVYVKFGISVPNNQGISSVRDLVDVARDAEQLGYHSVWVSEHLFHASYVAARLGDRPYHEALVVLTAIATVTERVRLGTSVLVLPWHHPALLAKQIASLDELSGGRVVLGVGVAQTEDEFANLGVPYGNRGAVTDEAIDAMRILWEQDLPAFAGAHFNFSGLRFAPKPRQSRLPILIGGNSPGALRRVREKGDGWHAMSLAVSEVRERIAGAAGKPCSIRLVLEFADTAPARPVTERRTLKGPPAELIEQLRAYASAGVDEIVVDANSPDLAATRACDRRLRDEVMSAL
ncbi:MAG: TIGR03619 family F420-dependent LLM class oxidoreductase [Proteobacteria bacterium]|nr:TIGR03619 family F420-dependent LLM class oxidoreductase [Pseudomonadota bacterium]